MIIHKRPLTENQHTWSVILNPIMGELAKSQTVTKLSQSFSISEEEAYQLVENAPVLLLEDLAYDSAHKIKEFFSDGGLDLIITNNPLQKRKCFKTVWPTEPHLNFGTPESTPLDAFTPAHVKKEILSSDQAIAHIREEIHGNNGNTGRAADERQDYQRKYEVLFRQYNLLVEEKLIQDKKMEALENENRFLKEKMNSLSGDLSAVSIERENLQNEIEALRIKQELLAKQAESHESPHKQKILVFEQQQKAMQERIESLQREYDEAEKIWARKVNAKDEEARQLTAEAESAKSQVRQLTEKMETEVQNHRKSLLEECLGLREKALRDLVKRQEELQKEITDKEKDLKNILSEQEKVEKEIVRAKQLKNPT